MAAEDPFENASGYEVLAVQLWRRVAPGSRQPDLTVAEAAAALGVSAETVRRRIRKGALSARKDARGEYRIVLALESSPALLPSFGEAEAEISRLRRELAETRGQLEETRRHSEVLVVELNAAMRAVGESQSELLQLWRQLGAGPIGSQIFIQRPEPEPHQRSIGADRIQAMIFDARSRFRRRRHPWLLAG